MACQWLAIVIYYNRAKAQGENKMRNQVKPDIIKLLQRLEENARVVQKSFEESGHKETAEYYQGAKQAYILMQNLLGDADFFDKIWAIYYEDEQ